MGGGGDSRERVQCCLHPEIVSIACPTWVISVLWHRRPYLRCTRNGTILLVILHRSKQKLCAIISQACDVHRNRETHLTNPGEGWIFENWTAIEKHVQDMDRAWWADRLVQWFSFLSPPFCNVFCLPRVFFGRGTITWAALGFAGEGRSDTEGISRGRGFVSMMGTRDTIS